MKCENCGAENPDEVKFCGKCGSPLNAQTTIEAEITEVAAEPQESETAIGAGKSNMVDVAEQTQESETAIGAGKSNMVDVAEQTQESETAIGAGKSGVTDVAAGVGKGIIIDATGENTLVIHTPQSDENVEIVNSNQPVTEHMTDAFNAQRQPSGNLTNEEKEKVKFEYLRTISKNPDVRDKQYDPKLIEVENEGKITDKNHTGVIVRNALKYWGLIGGGVIVVIILLYMSSFFGSGIGRGLLMMFALIVCGMIFLGVILNIVEFIECARSSRDSQFKLVSAIHILPIIVLLAISIFYFGIEATIGGIIGFVVIGVIGLICMGVMGRR